MSEEKVVSEALRIHAGDAGAPTLTLDDVRGRARSIRRQRAGLAATGAAVLVAAAVVPLALLVGGDSSRDALPPADTPTVSDTANPAPASVDQTGSWVEGAVIHPAEGAPFTPEVDGEVSTVIGLDDGRWVLGAYPGGEYAVVVTDSSGAVLATYDALDSGLSSDGAGTAAAWIGPDRRPRVLLAQGTEPVAFAVELEGRQAPASLLAVVPGCTAEECELIAEIYDDSPEGAVSYSVTMAGEVRSLSRLGLISITDVSPDGTLVTGVVSADQFGQEYCSGVLVLETGEELWRSCESGFYRFSPDGAAVLAVDAYRDGANHSFAVVLDALTGQRVQGPHKGIVFDETWTGDGDYLVLVADDRGDSVILRHRLDGGAPETVAGPVTPEYPELPAFRLTGR